MTTVVYRKQWSSDTYAPYDDLLHDNTDTLLGQIPISFLRQFPGLHVEDGDELEIAIRVTGARPFGERRWVLQKPNTYGLETDAQMNARLARRKHG